MSYSYLAIESTGAVVIAAAAAVVGAAAGAVGTLLAARFARQGAIGAAAQTGADAYGKAVRETRLDACTGFATAVRGVISGAQDMSNAVRVYNLEFGSDDRGPLPTQADLLALVETMGDAAVRVRIAGPRVVAEAADGVLARCRDVVTSLGEYMNLTASSLMPVDNPDMPITIMSDRPIIRHAEVQTALAFAADSLARFLDIARDHLDDWNGRAA
ncbi:hypothetical protein LG634_31465 [Streptomyces bambusae]|uniref:hypothetical protein n=1 Tax=Streptomyces bambusae TaxID=1550616 RepID=UPI001D000DE0|nr:hypothetical protein [Streptomyces bambusae]MCB5169316.1 hypothetical protein [Streptomyces bambusae]